MIKKRFHRLWICRREHTEFLKNFGIKDIVIISKRKSTNLKIKINHLKN